MTFETRVSFDEYREHNSLWHSDQRKNMSPYFYMRRKGDQNSRHSFMRAEDVTAEVLNSSAPRTVYVVGDYDAMVKRIQRDARDHGLIVKTNGRDVLDYEISGRPDVARPEFEDWGVVRKASTLFGDAAMNETPEALWEEFAACAMALKEATFKDGSWLYIQPTISSVGIQLINTFSKRTMVAQRIFGTTEKIIVSRMQARREVFPKRGGGTEFFYSDHRQFYQSVAKKVVLPNGNFSHVLCGNKIPDEYTSSWFLLTARVPDDWNHVGLINDGHKWPRKPGTTIHGWYAEPDMRRLLDHGWLQQIHERLTPEFRSSSLVHVVDVVERIQALLADRPYASKWAKALLLHAIGRLHPADNSGKFIDIPSSEFDPEEYPGVAPIYIDINGVEYARIKASTVVNSNAIVAPQFTAYLWSHARDRLSRQMLCEPFENLIGCDTDAIMSTAPLNSSWSDSRGYEFPYRLKGRLSEPFKYPKTETELQFLVALSSSRLAEAVTHGT